MKALETNDLNAHVLCDLVVLWSVSNFSGCPKTK